MITVSARRKGRVNMTAVTAFRPGGRPHLFYKLHVYHGRKSEPKSFTRADYRDLIVATHHQLGTPIVWVWDNLNVHLAADLTAFAEANADWLQIFHLPAYAAELNPVEGIWSLLKRSIANFIVADLTGLTRIIKRKLKKIRYRPHLINGCLKQTGLTLGPG